MDECELQSHSILSPWLQKGVSVSHGLAKVLCWELCVESASQLIAATVLRSQRSQYDPAGGAVAGEGPSQTRAAAQEYKLFMKVSRDSIIRRESEGCWNLEGDPGSAGEGSSGRH